MQMMYLIKTKVMYQKIGENKNTCNFFLIIENFKEYDKINNVF